MEASSKRLALSAPSRGGLAWLALGIPPIFGFRDAPAHLVSILEVGGSIVNPKLSLLNMQIKLALDRLLRRREARGRPIEIDWDQV